MITKFVTSLTKSIGVLFVDTGFVQDIQQIKELVPDHARYVLVLQKFINGI